MARFSPPFVPLALELLKEQPNQQDTWGGTTTADVFATIPPAPQRSEWPTYDATLPGRWDPVTGPPRFDGESDFRFELRCYQSAVYWAKEDEEAAGAPVAKRPRGRPPKEAYPGETVEDRKRRQRREAMARYRSKVHESSAQQLLLAYNEACRIRDETYVKLNKVALDLFAQYEAACKAEQDSPTV